MATTVITTNYDSDEFRSIIADCINQAIKTQFQTFSVAKEVQSILTRQDTAKLLSISLPTLHDYTKRGLIKAHRIGCKVRYKREEVETALQGIKTSLK